MTHPNIQNPQHSPSHPTKYKRHRWLWLLPTVIGIGIISWIILNSAKTKHDAKETEREKQTLLISAQNIGSNANCYIISEAGKYIFKTVKGNSEESVGNVHSAEVLWESFGTNVQPKEGDLIQMVAYADGNIAFQASDKKGNAVIAAKDAKGKILWSWHIWLTDQPKRQTYYNYAGILMDRNLGATCASPGEAESLGLLYQWGRKDPFLGSSSISKSVMAKSTIKRPQVVQSNSYVGTIEYATENPTTFIIGNDINYDWHYSGSEYIDNTRWTESNKRKSIYDPCPAGWRVPDGDEYGVWAKALGSSMRFTDPNSYITAHEGINFLKIFGPDHCIWYPAAGYLCKYGLLDVGTFGHYWSASQEDWSHVAYYLNFNHDGYINPMENYNICSYACSVRCVEE